MGYPIGLLQLKREEGTVTAQSPYQILGEEGIGELVDAFYDAMEELPKLDHGTPSIAQSTFDFLNQHEKVFHLRRSQSFVV